MKKFLLPMALILGCACAANAQDFSEFFTVKYDGVAYKAGETITITTSHVNIDDASLVDYEGKVFVVNNLDEPRVIRGELTYGTTPTEGEAGYETPWGQISLCYEGGMEVKSDPTLGGEGLSASGCYPNNWGYGQIPAAGTDTFAYDIHCYEANPEKDATYVLKLIAMDAALEPGMTFNDIQELSEPATFYIRICNPENGVDEITLDPNAPKEYFDLQGRKVLNPAKGLYIVKQGNKAVKAVIK